LTDFRTMSSLLLSAVLQVALSASAVANPGLESTVRLRIDPTEIGVDLFYSGATVRVEGQIPAGYDAAVLCSGHESAVELKKKGKVLGFLWMNVAEVVFENVPSIYLLSTSSPLAELAPLPLLEELVVGYQALESRTVRSPEQKGQEGDFAEFIKLKEAEKLYSYDEGGVKLEPRPNGATQVSAECTLPAKVPWGEYEVRLFGFKEGKGRLLRTERLQLGAVGVTAGVSTLVERHGLLYGILAVLIALGVGLLTGLVFGLGSKKSH
jgi:uncharacterized protein (TIGR02186 family)